MAQILIRGLPESLVKRLKERAKRNGRSLSGEVRMILAESSRPDGKQDALAVLDRWRERFKGRTFSDSAELIREDRDR
jgi:plasmid stability protein